MACACHFAGSTTRAAKTGESVIPATTCHKRTRTRRNTWSTCDDRRPDDTAETRLRVAFAKDTSRHYNVVVRVTGPNFTISRVMQEKLVNGFLVQVKVLYDAQQALMGTALKEETGVRVIDDLGADDESDL